MAGKIKLTSDFLKSLEVPEGKNFVRAWDSECDGLGIRKSQSGTVTFILQYRDRHGALKRPKLGRFPTLTISQARKLAKQRLAEILTGDADPFEKQKSNRDGLTLAKFFNEEYWPRYVEPYKKPTSQESDRLNFKNHLQPAFGNKKLQAIEAKDVQRFHAKMKDHPYSANRCLALLSGVFSKAQQWGFYEKRNPCKHIKRYRERSRVRYLSPEEFRRLGEAINSAREAKLYSESTIGCIAFLLWTGCRRGEAMTLRWEYIDFDRCRAFLPDSKTGAKELTLSPGAMRVIDRMKRTGPYVFPSETNPGEPVKELRKTWEGLKRMAVERMDCPFCDDDQQSGQIERDGENGHPFIGWRYHCEACFFSGDVNDMRAKRTGKRAKPRDMNPKDHEALVNELRQAGAKVPVLDDLRLHDLRHAFATVAVSLQLGLPIIGELLGHREQKTTAKYAHILDDAKRAASEAIYEQMREMMEPEADGAAVQDVAIHNGDQTDKADAS